MFHSRMETGCNGDNCARLNRLQGVLAQQILIQEEFSWEEFVKLTDDEKQTLLSDIVKDHVEKAVEIAGKQQFEVVRSIDHDIFILCLRCVFCLMLEVSEFYIT